MYNSNVVLKLVFFEGLMIFAIYYFAQALLVTR